MLWENHVSIFFVTGLMMIHTTSLYTSYAQDVVPANIFRRMCEMKYKILAGKSTEKALLEVFYRESQY